MDQQAAEKAIDENATSAQSITTRDGAVVSQNLAAQMRWADRKAAMAARQRGGSGLTFLPIAANGGRG